MPKHTTFEEYLQSVHMELFPTTLDDDLPDSFNDWLGTLDGEEYVRHGEAYGLLVANESKQHA